MMQVAQHLYAHAHRHLVVTQHASVQVTQRFAQHELIVTRRKKTCQQSRNDETKYDTMSTSVS